MEGFKTWLYSRWTWFLIAAFVVTVILSLEPPAGLTRSGQEALALLAAVVILFISEPIPLPGIILFIAIYQVIMGLGTPNEVAKSFMHDAVFFIMGALMIGVALTKQAIGKRLILLVIDKVGSNTKRISFAVISTCALLAGFIADHVVAAVMTPMVLSLVRTTREEEGKETSVMAKLLLFSVAYGASIGGLYAPSGGGRNVIVMGLLDQIYGIQIGYGRWILLCLPITLLLIPITSFIISWVFEPEVQDLTPATIGLREELEEKEFSGTTWMTLAIFLLTVVLWITAGSEIGLGAIALIGATLYLVFGIVDWDDYHTQVNWGVILIYMGALSLGSVLERSGAAGWIAKSAIAFIRSGLNLQGLVPIATASSLLTTGMTNLMSAAGAASVIGPITLKMGEMASMSPLFLGLLTAVSSAFGFLLLLATPPNAIIYSSGYIKPVDFLKVGALMTVAAISVMFLVVFTWWNLMGVF